MTRKQFEAKYPKTKIGKCGIVLYRSYDRKGDVIYVSVPE